MSARRAVQAAMLLCVMAVQSNSSIGSHCCSEREHALFRAATSTRTASGLGAGKGKKQETWAAIAGGRALTLRGGAASDGDAEHSPLGKKEHWEGVYQRELVGLEVRGDAGELWFEEENGCMERVSRWMAEELCEEHSTPKVEVLDVGTGNGMMLVQLASVGFRRLTGTDYVQDAVALARRNVERERRGGGSLHELDARNDEEKRGRKEGGAGEGGSIEEPLQIRLVQDDLLASRLSHAAFDILHDKGTLDAILLAGAERVEQYVRATAALTKPGGLCVITSCNLTEEELIAAMERGGHWQHSRGLPYPSFAFGGSSGSKVVTQAFSRSTRAPSPQTALSQPRARGR